MYFYSTHGDELTGDAYPKSARYTLGNLGYSKSKCDMMFLDSKGKYELMCAKGKMQPLVHRGILPENLDLSIPQDFCGDPKEYKDIEKCSKNVNKEFDNWFKNNCENKKECTFDI